MKRAKLEICCGNINDVIAIDGLDYDRIELNSALELGGLTPSVATLKAAKKITDKPICCMVRTRTADHTHTKEEIEVMYEDARILLENGADGIVFGFLDENDEILVDTVKKMREICADKELVFHKAFDRIKDKEKALETLIECGVDRILLMNEPGEDIYDATKRISTYQDKYGDKIELLIGGGVNEENILKLLSLSKATQVHGTFKEKVQDSCGDGFYLQVSRKRVKDVIDILSK